VLEIEQGLQEPPDRIRRQTEAEDAEEHGAEALSSDGSDGAVGVGGAAADAGGGLGRQRSDQDVDEGAGGEAEPRHAIDPRPHGGRRARGHCSRRS
jgi:hypothetical protein